MNLAKIYSKPYASDMELNNTKKEQDTMNRVTLWCKACQNVEKRTVQDTCSHCGKYAYLYILENPVYPQGEDIYQSLRSRIRADYIGDEELRAIKELCEYGLGENPPPAHYYSEEIPFETAIPQELRNKIRCEEERIISSNQ